MLRVVFDTNIFISALISRGQASKAFTQALQGRFLLVTSPQILDELIGKLTQKFQFTQSALTMTLADIQRASEIVNTNVRFIAVPRVPDDNRILECAVAGKADLIVTGDQDLLSPERFHNIPIITLRAFSDLLSGEQPSPTN